MKLTQTMPEDLPLIIADVHRATIAAAKQAINSRFTTTDNQAAAGMLLTLASAFTLADTFSAVAHEIALRPDQVELAKELLKALGHEGTVDIILQKPASVAGQN